MNKFYTFIPEIFIAPLQSTRPTT